MGHEYDCDKSPNEVLSRVFGQAGYLVQADWEVMDIGFYVGLVASQVEACAGLPERSLVCPCDQAVQGIHKARDRAKVSRHHIQVRRPALRQHLADTFPEFPPPVPALGHLLPEVLGIEREAVE